MSRGLYAVILGIAISLVPGASAADIKAAIQTVRQVGPNSKGSQQATQAWKQISQADVAQLPEILTGMDGASALSRNWLRSAIDQILDRAREDKKELPLAELEKFLASTSHDPQARRFAYELITEKDKNAPERLLPGMLNDPSLELRSDAVARVLGQAEKLFEAGKKDESLPLYQSVIASAREQDQLSKASKKLADLGKPVDLPRQLGLLQDWKLIGPFANASSKGTDTPYPPEQKIDLTASYDGKAGKVKWLDYETDQEYGMVDLNVGIGQHLEAVGYAYTEFTSKEARDVEIRIGCYTPLKLWVNGELILVRGDAYTGMRLDHYVAKAHLKPGKNTILMKVSQDNPPPQVAKLWRFQLRVCDAGGAAVLSTTRPVVKPQPKKG